MLGSGGYLAVIIFGSFVGYLSGAYLSGGVVSIPQTQPEISQRTGGDAIVYGRIDLFLPAVCGPNTICVGGKCSEPGESEPGKVVGDSGAAILARLLYIPILLASREPLPWLSGRESVPIF